MTTVEFGGTTGTGQTQFLEHLDVLLKARPSFTETILKGMPDACEALKIR